MTQKREKACSGGYANSRQNEALMQYIHFVVAGVDHATCRIVVSYINPCLPFFFSSLGGVLFEQVVFFLFA
jgi:hypothetical protein